MSIALREITGEDEPFLLEVYACTREHEMSLVPWSQEQKANFLKFQSDAQHAYYREQYPDAKYQLIVSDGLPVGRLYVLRKPDVIKILDITVLPQYRNSGIGSRLMGEIIAEADESKRPVQIWIEQVNPSQKLFRELGFDKLEDNGYQDLLQRKPQQIGR
jgi:ribosomal protein S18 acetylase RimI-like enzyme